MFTNQNNVFEIYNLHVVFAQNIHTTIMIIKDKNDDIKKKFNPKD